MMVGCDYRRNVQATVLDSRFTLHFTQVNHLLQQGHDF